MKLHPYAGAFTDANGQHVEAGDFVEHGNRFKCAHEQQPRRGILIEALSDGDATVFFSDTLQPEFCKWMNLCKIAPSRYTTLQKETK